jgi:two-component system, sporulation sensor kinase E
VYSCLAELNGPAQNSSQMTFHVHFASVYSSLASAFVAKPGALWLSSAAAVAAGAIELVERRNRKLPLDPARQIAISTLLESMPEAVLLFDLKGRVLEANQSAERLTCIPRGELLQMGHCEIAKYIFENDALPCESSHWAVPRALRGESVRQERRRLNVAGQSSLEALVSAYPIREPDGRIVGALVIVRDITELTQLQEHMADAEKHNVIGTMAASLTHDFNNVLDTISKAATVLEVSPERPVEERALIIRMIQNAAKRGAEIVGNVRQYLTGNQVASDSVDLNMLLEESIELTRPMWQAQRNVSIVRQFQPVPRVRANAAEMRRIFANLIINSLEAMPNGGTLIVGGESDKGVVKAFVEDTGEGIPADRHSRVFEPYYTTKKEGTGLGLSSALKVVRSQQGDITFTSKPGIGTRFVIEFPAIQLSDRIA